MSASSQLSKRCLHILKRAVDVWPFPPIVLAFLDKFMKIRSSNVDMNCLMSIEGWQIQGGIEVLCNLLPKPQFRLFLLKIMNYVVNFLDIAIQLAATSHPHLADYVVKLLQHIYVAFPKGRAIDFSSPSPLHIRNRQDSVPTPPEMVRTLCFSLFCGVIRFSSC